MSRLRVDGFTLSLDDFGVLAPDGFETRVERGSVRGHGRANLKGEFYSGVGCEQIGVLLDNVRLA